MAWLLRGQEVLGSVEVRDGRGRHWRGLVRSHPGETLILTPRVRWAHTLGSPAPSDFIFCAEGLVVTAVRASVGRFRVLGLRWRAGTVIQAPGGFLEWHQLAVDDQLELRS